MRNTEAGELVDEAFEEAVDRIESFRAREDDDEKGESREGGDGEERARSFARRASRRLDAKEAVDTLGEIAAAGEQRAGERRNSRSGAQLSGANQRGGKRERTIRVPRGGVIVSGQFGESRPGTIDNREATQERKHSRSKKKKETLEIIVRSVMRVFVAQGSVKLFRRQGIQKAVGHEDARTEDAGEGKERGLTRHDEERRSAACDSFAERSAFPLPLEPEGRAPCGGNAHDGRKPSR